jgi:hypothetical protein
MYLRELRIEQSKDVSKQNINIPFRWTAHHVREIFTALLPSKYTLDGSSLQMISV